jgi:hypothetical protein
LKVGCSAQAHEAAKHPLPESSFYLKENEIRAFIKPEFPFPSGLLRTDSQAEFLNKSMTLKEWKAIFEGFET